MEETAGQAAVLRADARVNVPGLTSMALSRDGRWLAAGTRWGLVRATPTAAAERGASGMLARLRSRLAGTDTVDVRLGSQPITAVAVVTNRDGSPLVVAASDGLRVIRQVQGSFIATEPMTDELPVAALDAFMSDGALVVAAAVGRSLRLYRTASDGGLEAAAEVLTDGSITCLALEEADRGHVVVFGDEEGRVQAWHGDRDETPRLLAKLAGGAVTSVATSEDDGDVRFAASDTRGTIVTDRVDQPRSASDRKLAHRGAVRRVAVADTPDGGPLVLSVGDDRVIRAWPLAGGWAKYASGVGDVRFLAIGNGDAPVIAFNPDEDVLRAMSLEKFLERALPNVERPETRAVSDAPIVSDDDDELGFGAYADALAFMIDHPDTSTPLSIAIDAPWGAGKTSLANLIRSRLAPQGEQVSRTNQAGVVHVSCWFNAWMHDDEDSLASALATAVVRSLARHRPRWRRVFQPVPSSLLGTRVRIWRLVGVLLVIGAAVGGGIWFAHQRDVDWLRVSSVVAAAGLLPLVVGGLGRAGVAVQRYVQNPGAAARRASVGQARDQLGQLIHQATRRSDLPRHRRFVLFIDDLERCEPPRALEVCQVVNQLVAHEDVVTVLLVDMETIAASAEVKYKDVAAKLYPSTDGRGYGQNFLEKVVQFHFSLPRHAAPLGSVQPGTGRARREDPATGGAARTVVDGLRRMFTAPVRRAWRWLRSRSRRRRHGRDPDRIFKGSWQRLKEWFGANVTGLVVYATLSAGAVVVYVLLGRRDLLTLAMIVLVTLLLVMVYRAYRREIPELASRAWHAVRFATSPQARFDHQQGLIAQALRSVAGVAGGRGSMAGLTSEVQSHLEGRVDEKLLAWEVRRAAVDDSAVRQAAEDEAARWLPAVPRKRKRVVNNLAVLLAILYERRLLESADGVSARQLGKWVAFGERFPAVARAVHKSPSLIGELTKAADVHDDHAALTNLLERWLASVPADISTMARMLTSEPRIDGVATQLTQHQAPGQTEPETADAVTR